jgi:hypothetical protein
MLKDIRAAVDRLVQRVDCVEAASAGGHPSTAPSLVPFTAAPFSAPAMNSTATACSSASTATTASNGATCKSLANGGSSRVDSSCCAGCCSDDQLMAEGADCEASSAHNGTQPLGTEPEGLLRYFSNLPFAQASWRGVGGSL